jgi:hypothetical protein
MYLPYTFTILVSILRNIYSEEQDQELFPFALTSITLRPLVEVGGGRPECAPAMLERRSNAALPEGFRTEVLEGGL